MRLRLGYDFVTDIPGTKEFQSALQTYLAALALRVGQPSLAEYATVSGIPVTFRIEFPFCMSTEGGSFEFVHVLTVTGIDTVFEAKFSVHLTDTIAVNIVSLESVITEPLVVNAVRKFIDTKQAVFYPEGGHPVQLQIVTVESSDYDYKSKKFVYHKATDEEIVEFLKRKVYWLGFKRGNQLTQVCIADLYDSVYLGVSAERLQQAAAILAAEGFVQIDSSGLYANAGTKLLQAARTLNSERAAFFKAKVLQEASVQAQSATGTSEGSALLDVFVSHATEDKAYVEPLVEALGAAGIRVWFDKSALEWGDDLRSSIDRGLANCRYGIVVFSKAFLQKKKWTEYELNSLFALEQPGRKVILPIWHDIRRDDLLQYGAGFADRLAKMLPKDSYEDIVESLLGLLGRSMKSQKRNLADETASLERIEPAKTWDVTEITLEAHYVNHAPDRQSFQCKAVAELPGKYVDDTSADGAIMRSEIESPALMVTGIDLRGVKALAWSATRLVLKDSKTKESRAFAGWVCDTREPKTLKFAIRSYEDTGIDPSQQAPVVAEPARAKPNAIAYAWYETPGNDSAKAKSFVRPSLQQDGWFTFENSFGEEAHGTKEEIAMRFAAFDKLLRMKHYLRMQHVSSDPAFAL